MIWTLLRILLAAHGTPAGYYESGCRCDDCVLAVDTASL